MNDKERDTFIQNAERKEDLYIFLRLNSVALNKQQEEIVEKYLNIPRGCGKTFLLNILRKFEQERGL